MPIPRKDKRRLAEESLDALFQPLLADMQDSDERHAIQYQVRLHWMRMFEYGAVTALQSLGFSATSRRVEEMQKQATASKTLVQKAAGDVVFEITDQEITDAIGNRITVVGATTTQAQVLDARNMIRDEVYLGTSSTQAVAEKLASAQGFPLWYSHRIARTEAQQSFQLAMFNTFQRSGVKKHEWVTVGDNRVRPQHEANELGGPVKLGDNFPSGEIYPGQSSPNCRCSLTPDLSDPNILLEPWNGSAGPYKIGPQPTKPLKPPLSKVFPKKPQPLPKVQPTPVAEPMVPVTPTKVTPLSETEKLQEKLAKLKAKRITAEKELAATKKRIAAGKKKPVKKPVKTPKKLKVVKTPRELIGVSDVVADSAVQRETLEEILDELGTRPKLVKLMEETSIKVRSGKLRAGRLGEYVDNRIVISDKTRKVSADLKIGKWSVDESVAGSLRHEYGHAVLDNVDNEVLEEWIKVVRKQSKKARLSVSEYGATDGHELFSEAFSAFTHPEYVKGTLPSEIENFLIKHIGN
jgi:hypothetical protein